MSHKFDLLLFDGDVIAFIAAAAVQLTVEDSHGNITPYGNKADGVIAVEQLIAKYRKAFGARDHKVKVCLSDRDNWRYDVSADYKQQRDEDGKFGNRPLLLNALKAYLIEAYSADYLPRCEADDYLSLLMTDARRLENRPTICIGRDKDFKSIPGWHYQIKQGDTDLEPHFIDLAAADSWHLAQSIAGDVTDGFKGCPGMGIKRALDVLERGVKYVPQEGVLTRGPNKGRKTVKWFEAPAETPWETVVSCYERAGLSEMDALDNARMAHLLRHGEFNFKTGEVKPWLPSQPE